MGDQKSASTAQHFSWELSKVSALLSTMSQAHLMSHACLAQCGERGTGRGISSPPSPVTRCFKTEMVCPRAFPLVTRPEEAFRAARDSLQSLRELEGERANSDFKMFNCVLTPCAGPRAEDRLSFSFQCYSATHNGQPLISSWGCCMQDTLDRPFEHIMQEAGTAWVWHHVEHCFSLLETQVQALSCCGKALLLQQIALFAPVSCHSFLWQIKPCAGRGSFTTICAVLSPESSC